ncbi:MAG: phosphoribosylformylglycinamidine synthase, partial [Clostridiales bacterium]|nr:phosphoribosylformylglycinamidine synthase [Clostridiales bacterium]
MVKRIFVEKKPGFDIEAGHIHHNLEHLLGISGIESVRMVNRYDVEGISDDEYSQAREMIFSEPPVDFVYDEDLPLAEDEQAIAYEYLPGQYDQRADSCAQCIQLITEKKRPVIRTARIAVIKGSLDNEKLSKIKKHLVNPVESRIAALKKSDSLEMILEFPDSVEILNGFIDLDSIGRDNFMKSFGLAMNIEDLKYIQKYFKEEEKRNPTVTEVRVIDTYWSDHCRHTTFLSQIDNVEIADSPYLDQCKESYDEYKTARTNLYKDRTDKPECLMDIAVMAMKEMHASGQLEDLEVSDEINACSIIVDADINGHSEEWLVMFKNETHNHPTEIEPFGGAATCLGGAIRDPLSGRAYVYQAMRVTGCGDPTVDIAETLPGKLPQIKITRDAAHGYSSYGNQIGLATGQVREIYDEGFLAKRLEIGAVIAAVPRENVKRLDSDPGDVVILAGGRTGRDGCGGATGSSKEHDEDSLATCGAEVQKGNPPTERKIQRLFRNPDVSKLIKKCNDFGAGGVAVAIGELAPGLIINLNKVPKKYEGLDGTELAISESQERMAVVVDPSDVKTFFKLAADENLECAVVADITDDNRLRMRWNGKFIVDLSRDFLDTNGVTQHVSAKIESPDTKTYFDGQGYNDLINRLKKLNSCSQKGLGERFDGSIGAGSILMPFGGKNQMTPQEGIAAKLPVLEGDTNTATLMTYGYNPSIGKWSTFHGACYAVLESVAKIAAMGGDIEKTRLTLQEYFEKLGKDEVKWGRPLGALLGAYYAQKKLLTPAIGGKDSMSGTFKDINVPPTLVSFAVSSVEADKVNSCEFKQTGSKVVLVEIPVFNNHVPDFNKAREIYTDFKKFSDKGQVLSAMTVKEGGIAETVANMSFGNGIGFESNDELNEVEFCKPGYGAIVAEVNGDTKYKLIGKT